MARSRLSTGRFGSARTDPALAGLVGLVVYALHGTDGTLRRDEATFVYGGIRFAHGVPPYRGIFNSVGPLGDMVAGVGTRIGWLVGLDAVTGARLVYLLLSAACVAGVSLLAREALGSRAAGLVAPAVFLTFAGFVRLAAGGPREKTITVLCLELAVVLLLRRRWFGAGVLTALATLAWQPALLAGLAAALAGLLTGEGPRPRRAAAYVVGGAIPTLLLAGYFLAAGAGRVAYWGFVLVNVGYTSQPDIVQSWPLLTADYGWSLAVVIAGWAAAVAIGAWALARATPERRRPLVVVGAAALVGGLWTCYAVNGGPDLFVVLPFAATGIAAAAELACRTLSASAARRHLAVVAGLAVVAAGVESVATRDHLLPIERRNVTAMTAALPPGSTVLSLSAPEVLVLAHRTNPYPWQLSDDAMSAFFDAHLPGGLSAYAARIARLYPALVAVGDSTTDGWLQPVLDRQYTRVGRGSHWVWYAADRLGRAGIARLRTVEASTWTSARDR
jgi:hypothetical protein